MPMRVGFIEFRKKMLERELEGIMGLLPQLGIEKAILTGDMITGEYRPDSRIDLVIVHENDRPFGRRADFFSFHLGSAVEVADFPPTDQHREVQELLKQRLQQYKADLDKILQTDLPAFNRMLQEVKLTSVTNE